MVNWLESPSLFSEKDFSTSVCPIRSLEFRWLETDVPSVSRFPVGSKGSLLWKLRRHCPLGRPLVMEFRCTVPYTDVLQTDLFMRFSDIGLWMESIIFCSYFVGNLRIEIVALSGHRRDPNWVTFYMWGSLTYSAVRQDNNRYFSNFPSPSVGLYYSILNIVNQASSRKTVNTSVTRQFRRTSNTIISVK